MKKEEKRMKLFKKACHSLFEPTRQFTNDYKVNLAYLIGICNSPEYQDDMKAPNDFCFMADGVEESIEKFNQHCINGDVTGYLDLYYSDFEQNFNLACWDREGQSIGFYTPNSLFKCFDDALLENLYEWLEGFFLIQEDWKDCFTKKKNMIEDLREVLPYAYENITHTGYREYRTYNPNIKGFVNSLKNFFEAKNELTKYIELDN